MTSPAMMEMMFDCVLRVASMLLLVSGLVLLMRGASAATRHAVWRTGFVVALLLPLLSFALPWRLDLLPAGGLASAPAMQAPSGVERAGGEMRGEREAFAGDVSAGVAAAVWRRDAGVDEPRRIAGEVTEAAVADEDWSGLIGRLSAGVPMNPSALLLMAWLSGALILAARLLLGHRAVRRILREGRRLSGPDWTGPLYEAADVLDVAVDVELIVSDHVTMPFTAGLVRPAIVVPASAGTWDTDRRRAVLMHELAHVRRRDLFSHHVARWVCALHWFNPLAWAGARRMRADSERAADDLVLNAGTRPSDYADHLLQIVSSAGRSAIPAPALPFAQRREFEGRVLAILEPGVRRRGPGPLHSITVTALVLLMTLPLAALSRAEAEALRPIEETGSTQAMVAPAQDVVRVDPPASAAQPTADGMAEDPVPLAGMASSDVHRRQSKTERAPLGPSLHGLLADADFGVPGAAARALGVEDDPRAVAALIRILRDDPVAEVRAAAAYALGEIEDPAAVPALAHALRNDRSADVRRNAAWALGEIEDARAVQALGAALGDADAEVRRTAMWALGEIESPDAVPGLVAALSSPDAELREQAAWALGQIESPAAVAALSALVADPVAAVRLAVVHALSHIEDPGSAAALTRALADEQADVRVMAAFTLGELSLHTAPPALIHALRDPHAGVRAAAAHALGEIADPAAIEALSAALDDDDDDVRMAAIHALLELDVDASTEPLLRMLNNEDPQVRRQAAEALGRN